MPTDKNSSRLWSFGRPVKAGIITVGNDMHSPKSNKSRFLIDVATT